MKELSPNRPIFSEWLIIAFTVFSVFVFYSAYRAHYPYMIDDAFITFRFAQNLAEGHGIVWNVGEDRVEGYSSPLMLLAMVPSFWLGFEAISYARILCILCNVIAIPGMLFLLIWKLPWSRNSGFRLAAGLLPGIWLMSQTTLIHTISGMETALACAVYLAYGLLVAHVIGIARATGSANLKWLTCVLVFSIMVFLVRSEGGAFACLGFAVMFLYKETRKPSVLIGAAFFTFVGLYLAWKLWYFGYLLPTPYYHKVAHITTKIPGLYHVWAFINHHMLFCTLIAVGWMVSPPSLKNPFKPLELICLAGFFFYAIFFLRVEHIMGYDFRFNWTTMPLILVLTVLAFFRISSFLLNRSENVISESDDQSSVLGNISRTVAVVAILFLVMMRFPTMDTLYAMRYFKDPPLAVFVRNKDGNLPHKDIGRILDDLKLSYDTTVIGLEAGIIPFYSGTRTNDEVGLTSLVFTHGTDEEKKAYLEEHPYDVMFTVSTSGALDDAAVDLYWAQEDPETVKNYSRERFQEFVGDYYYAGNYHWAPDPRRQYFVMWVRKNHPRALEIVEALRDGADLVDPDHFRFGPYDPSIEEGVRIPGDGAEP